MRKLRGWLIDALIIAVIVTAIFLLGMLCGHFQPVQKIDNWVIDHNATVAATPIIKTTKAKTFKKAAEKIYIGEFVITGYCEDRACCGKWLGDNTASGTKPTVGRTVGADWATLAPGTKLFIEGVGYRTVEDKPAKWIIKRYAGKIIDVFCKDHATALKIGRQVVKVYLSDN
jgi:3D (Asp-Asp-Asp) domain-containing protein